MSASNLSLVEPLEDDAPEEVAQALPVGHVIGAKYEIKKLLGMGGNGAVYEGEHTAVGHRVAIKVVHQKRHGREESLARFRREARICGSLRHPNIGQVYDVGMLDDGSPYMVMELQEGRAFGDILEETKLPIAAIIDITCQLLAGLGAAHRAGSIHRDVKPDNVIIVRDHDGEIVVKLVDFGISKSIKAGPDSERNSVTGEGIIIGSPDYMPPEQLRGDDVDVRADLYSTGVLLYEAITGRLPFDHEHLADLVASILRDPVTPPTALRPDCPIELELVVLRALSREPAKRYDSAEDMSRALTAVRAATRNAPVMSFASLSTPPPRSSGVVHTRRRRTLDTKTFEDLRGEIRTAVTSAARTPSRKAWKGAKGAAIGGAACAVVVLAWLLGRGSAGVPDHVVTTPLAAAPEAPPPPAATVTVHAAPPASEPPSAAAVEPSEPTPAVATSGVNAAQAVTKPAAPRTKPVAVQAEPIAKKPVEDIQPLLKQAATSFALGQSAEALSAYQRIVKIAPREAAAWRGLGVAASRLDRRAEAARAFARYLDLNPNAPDAARVRDQMDKLR